MTPVCLRAAASCHIPWRWGPSWGRMHMYVFYSLHLCHNETNGPLLSFTECVQVPSLSGKGGIFRAPGSAVLPPAHPTLLGLPETTSWRKPLGVCFQSWDQCCWEPNLESGRRPVSTVPLWPRNFLTLGESPLAVSSVSTMGFATWLLKRVSTTELLLRTVLSFPVWDIGPSRGLSK